MSVGRYNKSISNQPSGGGNKLQGLPPTTNKSNSVLRAINMSAWGSPIDRNKIIYMNQLSGIGPRHSQFSPNADGISNFNHEIILSENFSNGNFNNQLFNTSSQINIKILASGSGTGGDGGNVNFKSLSPSGDNSNTYSTSHYAAFEGNDAPHNNYKPLMEFYDEELFDKSNYRPRGLHSVSIKNSLPIPKNEKLDTYTIKNIKVSYIVGTEHNGGDRPDMHTVLYLGKLTAPENLYIQFVDKNYDQIGNLINVFKTKDPLPTIPILTNWYKWFCIDTSYATFLLPNKTVPLPNGTKYVPGQNHSSLTVALQAMGTSQGVNSSWNTLFVDNSGITNINQYDWNDPSGSQYNKPLIKYKGPNNNDPSGVLFTEVSYNINKTFNAISDDIKFRIFQERHSTPQDNYGIRYVSLSVSYKTKRIS
jgi:hypothetical protein